LPLRAGIMPFGNNKKLTMPRAQKTKVPAREDAWDLENETGVTGAEELGPPLPPTDAPAAPSPGRAKRKLAKDECDELSIAYMAWSEMDTEAEAELSMSLKLVPGRRCVTLSKLTRRTGAGKRHGSPFLELERIYKAELELTQAAGLGKARRGRGRHQKRRSQLACPAVPRAEPGDREIASLAACAWARSCVRVSV
jgi:hypothetical protein